MCTLAADATLGYEVIDTALALLITWIPVLYRRVLNIGIALDYNLDNGGVQLVFIATWRCATLQVADVRTLVGDDKRTLELTRALGIYTEVGRQLHRTAHTLRYVAERAIAEDSSIECGIEIIGVGDYRA